MKGRGKGRLRKIPALLQKNHDGQECWSTLAEGGVSERGNHGPVSTLPVTPRAAVTASRGQGDDRWLKMGPTPGHWRVR